MPKISIIVPAYNIKDYISECLDSLINQSYKDLEIIVVNDGSTDNTAKIVEEFSKKDFRVKLINQENQKVGMARNNGISHAIGDYIIFIDGDDKLDLNACEVLSNFAKNNDVVIFGAFNMYDNTLKKGSYSVEKIPNKFKNKNISAKNSLFKFPVLCMCKMYKKSFILENNIKFQNCRAGEDQIFHIKSLMLAKNVYVLNKNLYHYRRNRKNSLTYTKKQKKDISPILNFYEIEAFIKNYPNKFKVLDKYFIKALSCLGKCAEDFRSVYYNDLIKLKEFAKNNYPNYYWDKVKFNQNSSYSQIKLNIFITKFLKGNLCHK